MEIDRCPADRLFEGLQDGGCTLSGHLTTAKLTGGKNEGVMMRFLVFIETVKHVDVTELKKIVQLRLDGGKHTEHT